MLPSVTALKFYVHENRNHHHTLVYEWLLEQARKLGIHGGSVFKVMPVSDATAQNCSR